MSNTIFDKIIAISNKKTDRKIYIIILLLYIMALTFTAVFHEPWSDEAQAWQIARCASLHDIIFTIPHYEGHPPLWHLLLVPFAKCGLPYELSIKFINILFSVLAVWVMLYKTTLPDMLKITVPFTYFVFYQYGVLSRPYSLMFLALMLCAANFGSRNDKPFRYIFSMLLLCLSLAFGLAIACGLCILWIFEFLSSGSLKKTITSMIRSGVFGGLVVMLISAVLILFLIFPAPDSVNNTISSTKADLLSSIIYVLFGLIYDATVGNLFSSDVGLGNIDVISSKLFYIIPTAVLIWTIIIKYGKTKNRLLYFLLPYFLLSASFIIVRLGGHHIGIVTLLLIFWLCICGESEDNADTVEHSPELVFSYSNFLFAIITAITVIIQIMWSVMSVIGEINYSYSMGRSVGEFINSSNIFPDDVLVYSYSFIPVDTPLSNGDDHILILDNSLDVVAFLPYVSENCIDNFNNGDDDKGYIINRFEYDTPEYFKKIEYVESLGIPKYIFGTPIDMSENGNKQEKGFETAWDEWNRESRENRFSYYFSENRYEIVSSIRYGEIFKGSSVQYYYVIYKLCE